MYCCRSQTRRGGGGRRLSKTDSVWEGDLLFLIYNYLEECNVLRCSGDGWWEYPDILIAEGRDRLGGWLCGIYWLKWNTRLA